MSIGQMLVTWTGNSQGLPGVNVIYNDGVSTAANADLVTFFNAIKGLIPTGVSVTVPNQGDNFDEISGSIAGFYTGAAGGTIAGTGGSLHAAGVGVALQLNTLGIRNRRRIRGRIFLCPLSTGAYDNNGTLTTSAFTTLDNAANALATAGNLVVWSRPESPTSNDGEANTVVSASIPDRITSLRSRRF